MAEYVTVLLGTSAFTIRSSHLDKADEIANGNTRGMNNHEMVE
jgi:hypothetical protein